MPEVQQSGLRSRGRSFRPTRGGDSVSPLIFPSDLSEDTNVDMRPRTDKEKNYYYILFQPFSIDTDLDTPVTPSLVSAVDGSNVEVPAELATLFSGLTGKRYREVGRSIILYMPNDIGVNYSTDFQQIDTGVYGQSISGASISDYVDYAKELAIRLGTNNPIASAVAALTGVVSPEEILNLASAQSGRSFNPASEQLFKNVKFRNFAYSFDLIPRNPKEAKVIQDIIKSFKYYMHPSFGTNTFEFIVPSMFAINYVKVVNNNPSDYQELHKIGACFLEDVNVNYTGSNVFSAFDDAQPVHTKLTLKFRETVIHTKESIEAGY